MAYKFIVNKNYDTLFKDFIINIRDYFDKNDKTIHKARNELKVIEYENISTVVKAFKVPHFINRIVYTFFKDSKAKKSYDYSLKIGSFTPKPIAYIVFYKSGLLSQSYFISEEFKYDFTIREPLLDNDFEDKEEVLKAFARFTFSLHENQIFHQDYSPGNILIKKESSEYIFKIVDINRMKFIPMNLEQRLKNFAKLWMKDDDLVVVVKEYAKIIKEDEKKCLEMALAFSQKHKDKINMKKRLKGIEVVD